MNKRANLYLNIYGIISFILSLSCLALTLSLKEVTYSFPTIMRLFFLITGIISGVLFIAIEVFLFTLMNTKSKILYIGYILVDIAIAVLINTKIPYSAFLVFIILKITKDMLRVKLVNKIYLPKEFDRYCKMFNIKVSDFKKKKASTSKRKLKEKINISVEETIETSTTKSKSKRTKTPALKKAV